MPRIVMVLLVVCSFFSVARATEEVKMQTEAERPAEDIAASGNEFKAAGDALAATGDYDGAAANYLKALTLAREEFPPEERTRMATILSWGGEVRAAIRELENVLAEEPRNLPARLQLARCLSWTGRTGEAIPEAERILRDSPGNPDALLVKANALRWGNDPHAALPIYRSLLERGENFDARLGMTYTYLSIGNMKQAKEGYRLLRPTAPYQEKEQGTLAEVVDRASSPTAEFRYSYYEDTDENRVHRYSVGSGFWAENWKFDFGFRHLDARAPSRKARDDELSARVYTKVAPRLGMGWGVGIRQLADGDTSSQFVGQIKADLDLFRGKIGASLSREGFPDTAQLIENEIRFTNAGVYVTQGLPLRLAFHGSYNYKDYSDDNASSDVQLALAHTFRLKNPRIGMGYRFRYLNFDRETASGYFDPSDYVSHQGFVSFSYETKRLHLSLEPYFGHQSFHRMGNTNDDIFGGGTGVAGIRLTRNVSLEIRGEGGNYAVGSAAGFNYFQAGVGLQARF